MIKEYIEYLKDNPKGYWFKAKLYGWGWAPARWQGWVVLIIFLVFTVNNFFRIDSRSHSGSDTLINFVPQTVVSVLVLIVIFWKKGERPRWQWGLPKKHTK